MLKFASPGIPRPNLGLATKLGRTKSKFRRRFYDLETLFDSRKDACVQNLENDA
jgi:hypothetical protein